MEVQLSYSSAKDIASCEQKYFYRKVAQIPKDADSEESDALGVGKAFHGYLEDVDHGEKFSADSFESHIAKKCEEFEVSDEAPLVAAMALVYMKMHRASGLKVVKCEQKIETDIFVGYIDVILKSADGGWWIGDLKTAARFEQSKVVQLPTDEQLNLYASFATQIAPHFDLDPALFRGCRYRVATKTKSGIKEAEGLMEFAKRMYDKQAVSAYDAIVPVEAMKIQTTWARHVERQERAMQLNNGEAPIKNYANCFSYFRPCEYWSQCHGQNYTDMLTKSAVVVMTEKDYKEDMI